MINESSTNADADVIIFEMQEAMDWNVKTTPEEIRVEMEKFVCRLRDCIDRYGLQETPFRIRELDDVKSELTRFNYSRLFYFAKEKGG